MKEFQGYVESILMGIDGSTREKEELAQEFYDHLLLCKLDYLKQGLTEKEAIQLAINEFGQASELAPQLQKSMNPFYRWKNILLWSVLVMYVGWYLYDYFISPIQRHLIRYGQPFCHIGKYGCTYDLNPLNDFFEIVYHLVHSQNITNIFSLLFFLSLTYIPLGFLMTAVSRKSFQFNLLTSLVIFQSLHMFAYLMNITPYDSGLINQHLAGYVVGYFLYQGVDAMRNKLNKSMRKSSFE
ncbi:permease prefix domain 1-containing protein [Laceyella putida]|uniref:Permease prefix domain 1-containing protein n=1 Tax=Laceyella putida TaxID=110101 RepID=A0ABW2RFM4_9BACL